MSGKRWIRKAYTPDMGAISSIERMKAMLTPGKTYELQFGASDTGNFVRSAFNERQIVYVKRKYKLEKLYPHIALFTDASGFHESFGYWEIWRRMAWK